MPFQPERPLDLLTLLVVGLIAGLLAGFAVGVGYGIVGDVVVGIVGAFLGSWLFGALGLRLPFSGLGASIFVAFIGSVVLLVLLRAIRGRRRT